MEQLGASAPELVEATLTKGFGEIVELSGADRICWCEFDADSSTVVRKYTVGLPGKPFLPEVISFGDIPFLMNRLAHHDAFALARIEDLPARAATDRKFLETYGLKSLYVARSNYSWKRKGVIAIASYTTTGTWIRNVAGQFPLLANLVSVALERKDADDAYSDSEERFRYFFEQAPLGIAIETLDGRIVHANRALSMMTGYSKEELVRLSCAQISDSADTEAEGVLFGELREGLRSSYGMEKRFYRKDGSQLWGRVTVSMMATQLAGGPLVMGMVSDITARKAAEEHLRASESRLHSTMEVLTSRVAILDEAGTILTVNASWRKFAGEMPAGAPNLDVGANIFQVSKSPVIGCVEIAREVTRRTGPLLQSEKAQESFLQRCQYGRREWWFRISMTKFEENGAPRIVLSCQDVTELMRTQDALVRNQERLSLALEASRTGTWDWNITTRKICWTDNQGLVFSDEEKEFDGDYLDILAFVHADDRERVKDIAEEALRGGETFSAQFRIVDRQGATSWILAKGKISRDAEGKPVRMVGVNVDVTELRRRDQELQRLASRLISAHEEERNRISRELHDDIGQRVSLLACELDLRHQALAKARQPRESGQMAKLQKQAEELATDIHGLSHELHSSKLRHCGLELALRDLCEKYSETHHIKINAALENLDAAMPADAALCLFRVSQEALSNAVRHSGATTITVRGNQSERRVRLSIKDNGSGFDQSVESEGIGLMSMRERLRIAGGTLVVKSLQGHGTEILAELSIPHAEAAKAVAAGMS